MDMSIECIIRQFVNNEKKIKNIYFSYHNSLAPKLAYQVNFPRIEIILDGEQDMLWADDKNGHIKETLFSCELLYIESNSWNKPVWGKPVTTLSILFGEQQLGISLLSWDGKHFSVQAQKNCPRKGPRIGTFIIKSLTELIWKNTQPFNEQTLYFLIHSLLSYTLDLLTVDIETVSKTTTLFEAIRLYIDSNFREDLNRNFLADKFCLSPNYLSFLFQKEGHIGLNEYITQVRIENAKSLLKRHELTIKGIAQGVGFQDSNYFCRIFKKKTKRSPTEYRKQYHSKITKK